jgi:hypothetical protein
MEEDSLKLWKVASIMLQQAVTGNRQGVALQLWGLGGGEAQPPLIVKQLTRFTVPHTLLEGLGERYKRPEKIA